MKVTRDGTSSTSASASCDPTMDRGHPSPPASCRLRPAAASQSLVASPASFASAACACRWDCAAQNETCFRTDTSEMRAWRVVHDCDGSDHGDQEDEAFDVS